jgi:iron complex transport system ATP-binding protein
LPHQGWWGTPSAADHQAVALALQAVEMTELASRPMSALSGGERQRALLARALATQAPMLLMDEPLSHLDAPHQADWLKIVKAQTAQGNTVVAVLHELSVALMAHELVVMKAGKLIHHGPTCDATTLQALRDAFDGRIAFVAAGGRMAVVPA